MLRDVKNCDLSIDDYAVLNKLASRNEAKEKHNYISKHALFKEIISTVPKQMQRHLHMKCGKKSYNCTFALTPSGTILPSLLYFR